MKKFYVSVLIVGIALLLATESEIGESNVLGLFITVLSGYRLGLFNEKINI